MGVLCGYDKSPRCLAIYSPFEAVDLSASLSHPNSHRTDTHSHWLAVRVLHCVCEVGGGGGGGEEGDIQRCRKLF